MKIGLITIFGVNNYGAELQAFATQKALESFGHYSEIINYLYYKNWCFKDTKLSKPFVPLSFKRKCLYWLKYRLISWIEEKVLSLFNGNLRRRINNYHRFMQQGTYSKQEYRSFDELYSAQFDYDAYIVGSDQVWNYAADSSIEPYFLTFAPENALKFSYASSFGVSEIPENLCDRYKILLNNLDAISVREQAGVELVKKLTGRDAKLVLDPTLLLDKTQWQQWMTPVKDMPERYILLYQLMPSQTLFEVALKLGQKHNSPVYLITKRAYGMKKIKGIINILDAGPGEFLWLFANASCVLTNSFHGTAFAVNFERPFCCVLNPKRKNNSRMLTLLNSLDLNHKIIYEGPIGTCDIKNIIQPINTSNTLQILRNDSIKYIVNSLN